MELTIDPRITSLYVTAGVDVEGFEHRVRMRWNKSSFPKREKVLKGVDIRSRRMARLRWDQLAPYVRKAIIRELENRRTDSEAAD